MGLSSLLLFTDNLILKFIKFSLIGISGMGIDFGITYLLKEKIRINRFVSSAIGFCIAVSSNYYLNRIWTFESTNPHIAAEYTSFFIISIIGLGINTSSLFILASKLKWNFYFSKLMAIIITAVWNFSSNVIVTFNQDGLI